MLKEKIVTIGEKKYKFVQPTLAQSSVADMEFSKAYTNALVNGLLPKQALERRLLSTGAWVKDDDDKVEELSLLARKTLEKMVLAKTKEDKDKYLAEYYSVRNSLVAKSSEKQALFAHTAEAKGDEARVTELLWMCTYKEDASRLWENRAAFLSSELPESTELIAEFVSYVSGLDDKINDFDELVKSSYENVAVAEIEERSKTKKKEKKKEEAVEIEATKTE